MPVRSCHVIIENWKTRENDSCGIALDQLPPPQWGSALNRNRNRLLAVRVARPLHEANARVHAQRFQDRVGVKRESKDSNPDLASGRSIPRAREYLVGIEVEFRKIDNRLELPVCRSKTAPTCGKLLKLPAAHQHRDRLAVSGQFHRLSCSASRISLGRLRRASVIEYFSVISLSIMQMAVYITLDQPSGKLQSVQQTN